MARRGSWKPYGTVVELEVEAAGPSGEGLGTHEGVRYRVWGALPGERVQARIFGRKAGWRLTHVEEVLRPIPARIAARCTVFGACGGCSWQNLDYAAQLPLLEQRVRRLFEDAAIPMEGATWAPIVPSDERWHYRAKIELTFGGEAGNVQIGFNRRGRFWDIVDVEECAIGPPANAAIIARVRRWANERGLAPYRQRQHAGFLRYLVIRQERTSAVARWLAALVTSEVPGAQTAAAVSASDGWGGHQLARSLGEVKPGGSLLWVRSAGAGGAVKVDSCETLLGDGRLTERLGDVVYALGLESFFQANARMAARLVELVRELALSGTHRNLVDLYCGVGTITLALADACQSAIGVESVPAAVRDAEANARIHGLAAHFVLEQAEKYVWGEDVDLLVLDPPRSGLHPRLLRRLKESPVPRIIYISCNPDALARDLTEVSDVYALNYIQCVDMFPHTPHVETVVEMRRKDRRHSE